MFEIFGFQVDILSFIVLFPLFGAGVIALMPRQSPALARYLALAFSIIVLVPAIAVFVLTNRADLAPGEYAFQSQTEWFSLIGSSWHLGVDGVSAAMILLTAILMPVAILIAFEHDERPTELMALLLFMQTGMLGVFASLDMLIFFLFYEIGLVPMYFIIYLWGGENRDFAARKFFLFTMAGSLGLLLSIQLIAVVVGAEISQGALQPTFDITIWQEIWPRLSTSESVWGFSPSVVKWLAFLGFAIAFALKIPIFPLHTWLPDAHTEAPTAGSMLLAGVLLKLGAYGFIRLVIPLFPLEWVETRELLFLGIEFQATQLLALLAMLSIVFGAFSAWAQDDFKKLVAYSSVNHMGFVALGLAVFAAVYGSSYALSLGNRPDLVLSSFGDPMRPDDLGQWVSPADAAGLSENQQLRLASYFRLIADYGAEVNCNGEAIPTGANLGTCLIVNIPRLSGEGENPGTIHHATVAANGAVMQMFNHGLSAAGMFLLVGALYHKAHTRDLRRFGGLWHTIPAYGAVLIFTSMASLGLPGLNGFIGEYLVIAGAFPIPGFEVYVLISMLGLLITGAYILKGLQKVLHGPVNPEWQHYHEHHHSLEITRREMLAIAPLMALMLITGIFPNWILPTVNEAVHAMFLALVGG
jgi:proton-translocating NADH-quinone oxidoreductase chain M